MPVIDFTHTNTTSWVRPYNNQTCWYPEEITVLPMSETENQPQAHVLYQIKVETLHLNPYVQNAISADFLRNWDTRIIIKSLIGKLFCCLNQFE